jgi:hypothetical protein
MKKVRIIFDQSYGGTFASLTAALFEKKSSRPFNNSDHSFTTVPRLVLYFLC